MVQPILPTTLLRDDRIGFCAYDWAQAVFGNALLLIPVIVTDLASKAASPWGSDLSCVAQVDEHGEHCGLLDSGSTVCNSIDKCSWVAGTSGNASAVVFSCSGDNETCTPLPSNKCCENNRSNEKETVQFFGAAVHYKSVFAYLTSLSVVLQIIAFLFVGPIADFGNMRKRLLFACTMGGAACVTLMVPFYSGPWEVVSVLYVVGNVLYGLATVFHNGLLPMICPPEQLDSLSAEAFRIGYAGALLCLLLSFGPILGLSANEYCGLGLAIAIAMHAVWWAGFSLITFRRVTWHQGAPLPKAFRDVATLGLRRYGSLLKQARSMPQTGLFLIAYFIYSDGYSTITETTMVFAHSELCLGFGGIIGLLLIAEVISIVGCIVCNRLIARKILSPKQTIILNLLSIGILPILVVVPGVIDSTASLFVAAAWFGFHNGPVQAFSRSLFARMVPASQQNQYFALYEITDKGTAWLGPLVVAIVNDAVGSFRWAYFSLLGFFVIGSVVLYFVDVEAAIAEAVQQDKVVADTDAKIVPKTDTSSDGSGTSQVVPLSHARHLEA